MEYAYLFAALLGLALVAAIAVYFYIAHKEERAEKIPAKKPAAPAAPAVEKPPPAKTPPYPLPPGLPRTVETIKRLAREDPGVVANICKRWLRK